MSFIYREELQKQQAKERYDKLHMEGKTDEARADLARLALIRKQREDAAKKREEERKGTALILNIWTNSVDPDQSSLIRICTVIPSAYFRLYVLLYFFAIVQSCITRKPVL